LARLEALDGIEHAEVDSRGELLALSVRDPSALATATAVLTELGYAAEPTSDPEAQAVAAWYDLRSVGDLSRVEAGVIADRIVPPFAQRQRLSTEETTRLHGAVVDSLHKCFLTHSLTGTANLGQFRSGCVDAVEHRVRTILGPAPASALAASLEADMTQDHRHVRRPSAARDS
jgi:hypothetical protein